MWYKTLGKALYMDELVTRHGAIMDQYDPDKEIGMCVDEWGSWYKAEPGTNPGFLYQQNTVRDALIAGITLNTCRNPVMHMYRYHQGADLVESALSGVSEIGTEEWKVPQITESVSVDRDGVLTITLNNLSIEAAEDIEIQFAGKGYTVQEAKIVTNTDMHAMNTFDAPEEVTETDFTAYTADTEGIRLTIPKNSVLALRVQR